MADQVSDAILLERFVSDREEAAFVALIQRHQLRVKGTCRRILRNDHDVEDVLQATFLILRARLGQSHGANPWGVGCAPSRIDWH